VKVLCELCQVSRSGFYAWCNRVPSAREQSNQELLEKIVTIYQASRGTYGSPPVHAELKAQGECCGRRRVARLMRLQALVGRSRRVWKVNPARKALYQQIPNRLLNDEPKEKMDCLWVGDTTCFRVRGQWLHLAVVMDRFSRRVVGWSVGESRDNELVCAALRMALRERGGGERIFHSDQGIEYAAKAHRQLLDHHGITQSMSRKSTPYDNAHMESFFKTLKSELIEGRWFNGKTEAVALIMDYISYYNHERRHSSLDYISPVAFESKAA